MVRRSRREGFNTRGGFLPLSSFPASQLIEKSGKKKRETKRKKLPPILASPKRNWGKERDPLTFAKKEERDPPYFSLLLLFDRKGGRRKEGKGDCQKRTLRIAGGGGAGLFGGGGWGILEAILRKKKAKT